jgi:hypothetical protein
MKMILAGAAFAALLATPVLAQPLRTHDLPGTIFYQNDAQVRGDSRDPLISTQTTPNQDSMQQELCDTAHDFCPGFYGDNG